MADQSERDELIEALSSYVTPGARRASLDADYVGACVDEATALVGQAIGTIDVPAAVRSRAIIEAGSELFHRMQAPSGITQFAGLDGTPMRMARDPMVGARAILAPFLPLGFA